MKVVQHFSADGQPIIIRGVSDGTVLISGNPSRVLLQDCANLRVEPENSERITVSGNGNGLQWPLVMCAGSRDISFDKIELITQTDETSKQAWIDTVPNGFEARPDCSNIQVDFVRGERLHYAALGRCPGFRIDGGFFRYVSGDFVRVNGDKFQVLNVIGAYSLDVFGYELVHRDAIQAYQENKTLLSENGLPLLSGGLIKGCKFWMPDNGHKWAKSGDGYMFTDGEYRGNHIEGNELYTNNVNGLRGDVMRDNEITPDNIFGHAQGEAPQWTRQ